MSPVGRHSQVHKYKFIWWMWKRKSNFDCFLMEITTHLFFTFTFPTNKAHMCVQAGKLVTVIQIRFFLFQLFKCIWDFHILIDNWFLVIFKQTFSDLLLRTFVEKWHECLFILILKYPQHAIVSDCTNCFLMLLLCYLLMSRSCIFFSIRNHLMD